MRLRKRAKNQREVNISTSAIMEDMKLFCQVWMEFWSNSNDSMANLGTDTTEHASEMELYIILATLENFECWNQILLITQ